MKKWKTVLGVLIAVAGATAVFFGAQILLSLVSLVVISVLPILLFRDLPQSVLLFLPSEILNGILSDYTMLTVFLANLLTVAVILLVAYGLSLWRKQSFFATPSLRKEYSFTEIISLKRIPLRVLPLLFLLGVTLNAAIGLIWSVIPFPKSWIDAYESSMASFEEMNLLTFLAVAISAPLAEELVTRSVFLSGFRRFLPSWVALLSSSLLFAVMHGNPYQISYAFVGGVFLGSVFLLYDSVAASIVMHFGFNTATFIFQLFTFLPENDTGALVTNILFIVIAALSIPIFLLLLREARKKRATMRPVEAEFTVKENTDEL
jgi:membrane protease YdiL (CAAX protease family)